MVDDRTSNLGLVKPNKDNTFLEDVDRIRSAFDGFDAAVHARQLKSEKGVANGYAGLDSAGKVPASQLPSYVDDVLEYASQAAFPGAGDTGKIYVALDNGKAFRWSGTSYVEISASPGSTDAVPEGASNLYFTVARVRAAVLTGLSTAANAVIDASDSVLSALGKLQAQISATISNLSGHTGASSDAHAASAISNVAAGNVSATTVQGAINELDAEKMARSGDALTGGLFEARVNLGAGAAISLTAGNYFTKTVTGTTAFSVTGTPVAGSVASFVLDLTNGGSFAVSWWANLRWANGIVPSLTPVGRDVLAFFTHDGGTTWSGFVVGKNVK